MNKFWQKTTFGRLDRPSLLNHHFLDSLHRSLQQFQIGKQGFALIRRGNRLSIMPVSEEHWDFILSLE